MNVHIVKESADDDSDSIFIYIRNFITEQEEEIIKNWLNSMTDFKINMNYDKTKIIRLQKW